MTLPMCEKHDICQRKAQRCPIPAKKNAAGRRCFFGVGKKIDVRTSKGGKAWNSRGQIRLSS